MLKGLPVLERNRTNPDPFIPVIRGRSTAFQKFLVSGFVLERRALDILEGDFFLTPGVRQDGVRRDILSLEKLQVEFRRVEQAHDMGLFVVKSTNICAHGLKLDGGEIEVSIYSM
jgi:hypothetical protein